MERQCWLELTEEQLRCIEEYAASLMSPEEIAILVKVQPEDRKLFCQVCNRSPGHPVYDAYHRGRLATKSKFRKATIKLAEAGSPAAAPIVEKMLNRK